MDSEKPYSFSWLKPMLSRREFLKTIAVSGGLLTLKTTGALSNSSVMQKYTKDPSCTIYRAINASPEKNLTKVIELMGGIENIIGFDDIVVIKPNVQWWNQGAPNLSVLKNFVDLIMKRPGGFKGEVIIAENCHRGPSPWESMSSGWKHPFEWNSDIPGIANMNDLSSLLKKKYGESFSTCHWIDVKSGGRRIFKPSEGNGYIYCDGTGGVPLIYCDNGDKGNDLRAAIMTYPIFLTDKGTTIDFKNGIWERGSYTEQPLRFINFVALNHHSTYCGVTSTVKNYLGVSDLSGGPDPHNGGRLTKDYYNFHSFPLDKWTSGPVPGMIGAEVGVFMNTIRKADLNITTAEWVGLASRTKPPIAHTCAVLASTDPVALDYHASKYLLYPNSKIPIHNPDAGESPLHQYLIKCAEKSGGIFDEKHVGVNSFDFQTGEMQDDSNLVVSGEVKWGNDLKTIMKYIYLRYVFSLS